MSPASVHARTSVVFTRSPVQGPYDHQTAWGRLRMSFPGVVPSGCVNPECTNENACKATQVESVGCLVLRYQEKMQIRNQYQRTAWGTGIKTQDER